MLSEVVTVGLLDRVGSLLKDCVGDKLILLDILADRVVVGSLDRLVDAVYERLGLLVSDMLDDVDSDMDLVFEVNSEIDMEVVGSLDEDAESSCVDVSDCVGFDLVAESRSETECVRLGESSAVSDREYDWDDDFVAVRSLVLVRDALSSSETE